jgi:hypothetical protein
MVEAVSSLMDPTDESVTERLTERLIAVERELWAFRSSVNVLHGPAQAQLAVEDWLRELENSLLSEVEGLPSLRQLSIGAAQALAERVVACRPLPYSPAA